VTIDKARKNEEGRRIDDVAIRDRKVGCDSFDAAIVDQYVRAQFADAVIGADDVAVA